MARVHRTTARHFMIGVLGVAVLGVVAAVGVIVSVGGPIPTKQYTYAKVEFADVGPLKIRQDVRQNSMVIGQISAIDRVDGHSVVTLRINGDHPVYRNATARLWNDSALARQFVELDPGTQDAGPLGDAVIQTSGLENSIDLDQLLNIFDVPTRQGLRTSLDQLGRGFLGHSADLADAMRSAPRAEADLGVVSTALVDPATDLPDLLKSADRLTGRLTNRREQIASLIQQTATTLEAVNVDGAAPLRDTLAGLPPTLRQARQALDSLNGPLADTHAALLTLRPGGHALGASAGDLRGVLREAVAPLDKVPAVAEKAEPAVDDLTDTVSDARPLVPRLVTTLESADRFISDLAPYSPDAGRFFSELAAPDGLLSARIAPGQHFFRAIAAVPPGPGLLSVPDPTFRQVPYPTPGGGAWSHPQPRRGRPGGTR